ncbi:NAD(P)/FAD-dependent oxidoreductase [Streptomyces sp. S.PB5]|uniref:NAD(P)/FAD-dependent oxidoreductase n=1 Tax=Streptomyces sp. S.PB5 TaxID=3020844 RepID=UPI0025B003FA|nr:NAD(P)/FAD-dependent oxidoreductase [Streptomyces sp. S.PB5]MDN3027888.1 NAD(P)/FAD-dependent oxidoreductase [Streptomyces sp. S.PB5]
MTAIETPDTPPAFPPVDYDVVIAGGGLAGLCLAKQLRDAHPQQTVLVCERSTTPLPVSAFKVGESTVEVGAHYFAEDIGLRDYLESEHLEKLGLRYFYGGTPDFPDESEFGVSQFLPAKSYQLNRGTLEEHLRKVAVEAGAELVEGVFVEDILLGESGAPHRVVYRTEGDESGATRTITCRWTIDATGRRRIIQRKLGLEKRYPRRHNSVWFRLDGRLDIDEAVGRDRTDWHDRVIGPRWHSTNHLMFEGGWVWLIPLAPDHTSVGIVVADHLHPIGSMNRIDKALDFVAERLPALDAPMREMSVLDFRVLRDYSHSSQQVFSGDRWACIGEAAVFADPYYSVGSNLIAYANGFVTKMVGDDAEGRLDGDFVDYANRWFLSLAEGLTNNIQLSYPFHHRPVIMALKTLWDYYVGWAFSDPQYYQRTFLNKAASTAISGLGAQAVATQNSIMRLFSDWSARYRGTFTLDFLDYIEDVPTLTRLFVQNLPGAEPQPFTATLASIRDGLDRIEELAHVIFHMALEDVLPEHAEEVREHGWLNVAAMSLDPERWERDGLFTPRSKPRPETLKELDAEMRALFRTAP